MARILLSACAVSLLIGCAGTSSNTPPAGSPRIVAPASDLQKAALLDRIKSLAGTWEMADEKGQFKPAIIFSVGSKGSAVREIMFPGDPYEMTNMYHMDGGSLLVTHYCAEGNQPRMRAVAGGPADRITFVLDSVTNMTGADQSYMGQLTLVFKDRDNIREEWASIKNGKTTEHAVFDLRRKKGS